jgi:hypothetical protein
MERRMGGLDEKRLERLTGALVAVEEWGMLEQLRRQAEERQQLRVLRVLDAVPQ